jgi:hypothetical protein
MRIKGIYRKRYLSKFQEKNFGPCNLEKRQFQFLGSDCFLEASVPLLIREHCAIIPSRRSDLLSVNHPDTLGSLERDQHLVLTEYSEDGRVLITVPPIFIDIYIRALRSLTGTLRKSFLPGWVMEWNSFEIFVAEYVAFRINALLRLGHKTVALKNIFRDAYGSTTLLGRKVELRNITVNQLCNKFPTTTSFTSKQLEIVDFKSGMIVNGDKAPFADSFYRFRKCLEFKKCHVSL